MENVLAETDLKAKHLIVGVLALICVILLCYAEILFKMAQQWFNDPNYSHGLLIPVISGYLIWKNKNTFNLSDIRPTCKGLFVLVFGLLLLIIGKASGEFFTMRFSFIIVILGLLLFTMGVDITKNYFSDQFSYLYDTLALCPVQRYCLTAKAANCYVLY